MNTVKPGYVRPLDLRNGRVDLGFGAGGRAMAQLISELFARAFANDYLARGDDGAVLPAPTAGERLVMATDAHVVSPLFFPGGDIGSLSVHGTVNDLAVMGARPLYLAASFILEEGYALAELARIVDSMAVAGERARGVDAGFGEQRQGLRGLLGVELRQRIADMHDHVVADGGVVDQGERDLLAHAAELDAALVAVEQLDDAGGDGETHLQRSLWVAGEAEDARRARPGRSYAPVFM